SCPPTKRRPDPRSTPSGPANPSTIPRPTLTPLQRMMKIWKWATLVAKMKDTYRFQDPPIHSTQAHILRLEKAATNAQAKTHAPARKAFQMASIDPTRTFPTTDTQYSYPYTLLATRRPQRRMTKGKTRTKTRI